MRALARQNQQKDGLGRGAVFNGTTGISRRFFTLETAAHMDQKPCPASGGDFLNARFSSFYGDARRASMTIF